MGFEWSVFVKILLAMVFARNSAMGFNRLVDRVIDAKNPRTASREIPSGKISIAKAKVFVFCNVVLFILTSFWLNNLCGMLSPVALIVILGYSYTKRFTALCHLVLGLGLGIAPIGAFMAVTGELNDFCLLLGALVATWTAGFDVIYALQDRDFDRAEGLHSIPSKFSVRGALYISIVLHVLSLVAVYFIGSLFLPYIIYYIGAGLFALVLVVQHILARESRLDKIGSGFALINGMASIVFAGFVIAALFF